MNPHLFSSFVGFLFTLKLCVALRRRQGMLGPWEMHEKVIQA